MKTTHAPRRTPLHALQVPLTFRSFGAGGGHLVVESWWKELTVPLIIDTGSTHSLLHAGLFFRDGSPQRSGKGDRPKLGDSLQVLGGGGNVPCPDEPVLVQNMQIGMQNGMQIGMQNGMQIGGFALPAQYWSLIDLGAIRNRYREYGYSPPCGLIGLDLLRRMKAVLNCSAKGTMLQIPRSP